MSDFSHKTKKQKMEKSRCNYPECKEHPVDDLIKCGGCGSIFYHKVCLETYENEKRLKQNIRGSNLCYTCFLALESDQKHQDDEIHKDDEQTETVVETKTPTLPTIPTNLGLTGSFQPPSCIGVSMLRSFSGTQAIAGTVVAEEYKEPTPPIPPMLL